MNYRHLSKGIQRWYITEFLPATFCASRRLNDRKQKNLNHKDMKNLTKTLLAVVLTAVVLTSSTATTFAANQPVSTTTIATPSKFNRISVSGKVKIILTQGKKQAVVGSENYKPSTTSVMTDGQTLYVNSTESELVTLNITVKDLERVVAHGQSVVVTSNNFDIEYLQVFLHENARAKIKTTVKSLYTVVEDDAVLKLNGKADQSTLVANNVKNLKLGDFASLRSESYITESITNADATAMSIVK
jgi:hypothetical protein